MRNDDAKRVEQGIETQLQDRGRGQSAGAPKTSKSDSERSSRQNGANPAEDRDERITRIGSYKILKQIGEGPSSLVYQAEQSEPVQLRVAIKLIKHGLDWRQIVARLEAERHELQHLEHPNIAKLLGAGARQSGQPYVVMELVEGLPLTKYCDKHKQSLQQRLEMFLSVCQAVQHAHQKGIIHGDLKPSNVLVSSQKDNATPKVLDFGLARAVRRKLTEEEPSTGPEILGDRPEYVSPEQADPHAADIDTRSDVYSLGVLLYELVTGTTPLTEERLEDVSTTETLRLIREEDPPAPSTRLLESPERKETVAAKMQMKSKKLLKAVSGDLDHVVKKALAKDPKDRYATVSELARDIQRYLDKEPVEASPPSTRSQLRTLRRKHHRVAMMGAMIVLFSFLLAATGIGLAVWAWVDEHHAKKAEAKAQEDKGKAEKGEKEAKGKLSQAEKAYKESQKERDQAREGESKARKAEQESKAILTFFKSKLLGAGRPADVSMEEAFWAGSQGKDVATRKNVTLRMAVEEAERQVTKEFMDRPLAEATVRGMLGLAYLNVGEADKALKEYERAFALRSAVLGDQNSETADARNRLAIAYRLAGKTVEASRLFHHDPNSSSHADALAARGAMLLIQKKPAEAELYLRESLTIREKNLPENWTTFQTESMLGEALLHQKKYVEAEPRLLGGYQGLKDRVSKIPTPDRDQFSRSVERLVQLYEAWGKADQAAKWRKELETIRATNKP